MFDSNTIAVIFAGILAGALMLRKFVRNYKEEGVGISTADAKVSVIELMRAEVERMSKLNQEMSIQISTLREENTSLREEINILKDKISDLNIELTRLSEQKICIKCSASLTNGDNDNDEPQQDN